MHTIALNLRQIITSSNELKFGCSLYVRILFSDYYDFHLDYLLMNVIINSPTISFSNYLTNYYDLRQCTFSQII